jgi:periplasmic protein CpxP/Spy
MNTTKATILLGVLLSAGMVLAQAPDSSQTPSINATTPTQSGAQHRNFDPAQQAARLSKRLGLNSDQVAQIQPILADRQQKVQTLRADTSLSQQDRHTKVHAIMQASDSKIEAVLSDTQKQQFEQMLVQRRSHQHNRQSQSTPSA